MNAEYHERVRVESRPRAKLIFEWLAAQSEEEQRHWVKMILESVHVCALGTGFVSVENQDYLSYSVLFDDLPRAIFESSRVFTLHELNASGDMGVFWSSVRVETWRRVWVKITKPHANLD